MSDAAWTSLTLPVWAKVDETRRGHIARVTVLLGEWANALGLDRAEAEAWRDAGLWHDALRDAPEKELRELAGDVALPAPMLHGPAAAARVQADNERRRDVVEAIRWHTVGCARWARTGRALYLADYLEPGRPFARREREALASRVPVDFNGVFRHVVRTRLEWSLREGNALYSETVELWNQVR